MQGKKILFVTQLYLHIVTTTLVSTFFPAEELIICITTLTYQLTLSILLSIKNNHRLRISLEEMIQEFKCSTKYKCPLGLYADFNITTTLNIYEKCKID